jgi:hypothetical protein
MLGWLKMAKSPLQNPLQSPHVASVDPRSLSIDELVRMLTAGGGRRVLAQQVQADLEAGAPTNVDGTINLVHYAAWLLREVQSR